MTKWNLFQEFKAGLTLKNKLFFNFSVVAEKALDKIQYPFMIKSLNILGGKELPHLEEGHVWKTASIILRMDDSRFFPKIKSRTRISTLTTAIQHGTGGPSHHNNARKKACTLETENKIIYICRWYDNYGRLYFPKMVSQISPIPYALLIMRLGHFPN